MRRVWANAALLLAALLLSLAAVELAMAWLDYDYRPLTISARDNLRDTLAFNEEHFEFDRGLLWRPRRGYKIFNQQGFRGPVLDPERRPGEVRIATVGDSNTLGWRGEDGAHWPGLLDRLAGPEVRVVNAGVWGYSSFQGVLRLREVLPLAPDVVTLSFGSNDARPVRVTDVERSGASQARALLKGRFGRLRLGRVLIGGVDRLWALGAAGKMRRRVGLDLYRDNLRTMIGEIRVAGARPVLLTRPYIGAPPDPSEWRAAAPDYNAATVDVAGEAKVPVVDLYSHFKHRAEYFADDSHFTPEGHQIAARLVYEELLSLLEDLKVHADGGATSGRRLED